LSSLKVELLGELVEGEALDLASSAYEINAEENKRVTRIIRVRFMGNNLASTQSQRAATHF
jgi:hypothetical protein